MSKNTSISLGNYFEDFVNKKISSGRYSSVSEVVRTGLRLLENEEQKLEKLKGALDEGEKSKKRENFDTQEHLQSLHNKHA